MDDTGAVFLFIMIVSALVYAYVIERRRRRDGEATEEKFKQVVRSLELLEQRLRAFQASVPLPQTATAASQPDVHILSQPMAQAHAAAAHSASPAHAPLIAPKPAAAEKPAAPAVPPQAPTAPTVTPQPAATPAPFQATCAKCGTVLLPAALFCTRCGAIAEVSKPASQPAAAPPPPPPPAMEPKVADATLRTTQPVIKPAPAAVPPPAPAPPMKPAPAAHSVVSPGASAGMPPRTAAPPAVPPRPPSFSGLAQPAPKKPSRSFEEMVGTNWLPKLAVVIGVVGAALLTANQWDHVTSWWGWIGPWGRDAVILLASLGLLFGGIKFETRVRYKTLGRAMIGGGWALTFLVAYAIRHAQAFRVLPSDAADLAVLLVVAAAMVWHTLKYNSQTVTGLAFLLGFTAVTINPDPPFNLLAGALLIAGMTVIVLRRQWFPLELAGILASYANHFYWLYQVYEHQGERARFPHYTESVALVIGYWVIFRASYLVRKITSKNQEVVSTWAGLLNPILFLLVMKYQGFHPDWAWRALLVMGAVEFTLGQLPSARQRRAPFQLLSSLGVTLMVAAPVVRGSGDALETIWLAGAVAFLIAGILPFTRERLFRWFGLIISFLVALYALLTRVAPLGQQVFNGQPHHDGKVGLILAAIAVVLWGSAHISRGYWRDLFEHELEDFALTGLSYSASLFAVAATYACVADPWIALVLALLVAWLCGISRLFSIAEMIYQAHWIAAVAFIQVLVADRALEAKGWIGVPQRVWAFASVAGLLYLSSRFVRLSETRGKVVFAAAYTWAGTSLLTLLIWFQATNWAVAVTWIALGLALSLVGHFSKRTDFKWQAFALVVLATLRVLLVNIDLTTHLSSNPATTLSHITYRMLSVALIALGTYLLALWAPVRQLRPVYTAMATLLLALLAYKEAPAAWTALCWIVLAMALSAAALWLKQADLKWQGFVLVVLSFGRTLIVNFELTETFHSLTLRLISVSLTALGIYLLARWAPLPLIRPVYSVSGTLLLGYLAFKESPAPWTAVFWVGLALVLCLAARGWKDRALLWQTHLLSVLAAGWTLYLFYDPQYRGTRVQWITVAITAAVLYALTWLTEIASVIENARISQAYPWAASLLVSWLVWYQLPSNSVALVWGLFGLLLFEFPDLAKSVKINVGPWAANWRAQAYVALAGGFVRVFIANFNTVGWAPALVVACLAAIYFFIYWELGRRELSRLEQGIRIDSLMACLGTAALAALARFELPVDAVVIGYAGLVAATLLVAWLAKRQIFLFQALVMLGVTAFRISMSNFYHLKNPFSSSLSGAIWAIALLAGAVPLAFQVRKHAPSAGVPSWFRMFALHPEQPMFFVPVGLTVVLLYLKVSGWKLTGEWAVAGLVVWVLALWAKERSFRLTGLALVLLSVGKILFWDTWQFNDARKYIGLMAVSLILLILSFLYGKYKEAIREYV